MIEITEIYDPRIKYYRNLKNTPDSHKIDNVFIAEGKKVIKTILKSEIEITSIFALPEYYDLFSELINPKNIARENQFTAEKSLMNEIVGFKLHQGVMAIGIQPKESNLEDLNHPIIILNGIINSENVGSIVRNAAAFGINSIIYDKQSSSPYLRRAVRVSMGTIFGMNYYQTNQLSKTIYDLKNKFNFSVIAAEISEKSIALNSFTFKENSAFIFGNEGNGISDEILELCDNIIHIPINSSVPSLNVAASSAIILNALQNK